MGGGMGCIMGSLRSLLGTGEAADSTASGVVEVLDVPALVPVAVQLGQPQHFIHGRPPRRDSGQAPVQQSIQSPFLVAINVPAEGPLVHPQQPGRFFLREPTLPPACICLCKSHLPGLL